MQEGIGVIEASQKAIVQRSGGRRKFISFSKGGSRQFIARENSMNAVARAEWASLPQDHRHVQPHSKPDPAWGQGVFVQWAKQDKSIWTAVTGL